MKQRTMASESAYALGMLALALGTALMEKADFGMSMVVAPAYLLYLKLSQVWSFVTFGMMEYALQAALLLAMSLALRRFRAAYLFSFVTAVLYGFTLDGCMLLLMPVQATNLAVRAACYAAGLPLCSLGVAFMFHTHLAPEAYELVVKELSARFGVEIGRFKTGYDLASCLIGVALSFAFFGMGHFEGVKGGTIFCALVNGSLIGAMSRWMDGRWEFRAHLGAGRSASGGAALRKGRSNSCS